MGCQLLPQFRQTGKEAGDPPECGHGDLVVAMLPLAWLLVMVTVVWPA